METFTFYTLRHLIKKYGIEPFPGNYEYMHVTKDGMRGSLYVPGGYAVPKTEYEKYLDCPCSIRDLDIKWANIWINTRMVEWCKEHGFNVNIID